MDVDDHIARKLVHEIHTSERRSFRACRRRWDWLFRQNYYPKTTAKPLEFGSAFHKAMETYYNPETWSWDRVIIAARAEQDFVEMCEAQKVHALKEGELYLDAEVEEDYQERVNLGRGMMRYYFAKVAPREDVGWKPVKVEISFMVPVPNPETGEKVIWCKCRTCFGKWNTYHDSQAHAKSYAMNAARKPGEFIANTMVPLYQEIWEGLPVVYAGRLDMLAEDEHGNYWIYDWKTARSISENDEFLYLDDQIGSYVWALRKLGINVRGFVYVEIRKGYPQPPKQNSARRLGRKFSVNKAQEVDYPTYKRTVEEEDPDAYADGLYDEILEFLRNEGTIYHKRWQIPKSFDELVSIGEDIGMEALDMIDPKLRIYKSAGRFGCNFCAFRQPCMEKNAKGDYQYALDTMYEQREHYYVRAEASTESKGGE